MQSFGAFLQCFKEPMATYKCLESFRIHYPDNTIVLLSDNGYNYENMAKHFNCIYIHSNENVPLCNKDFSNEKYIENVNKIIKRFESAFCLIPEDFVMWLEDDVVINNKITDTFRYDINGFCPNHYTNSMIDGLNQNYNFINRGNIYRWSGHGGSVFNKVNLLKYFENKEIINDVLLNWKKYNLTDDICHDFFISLLVNLNKGSIGYYSGHKDCYNGLDTNIVVQHQYKVWYKKIMSDEVQNLVIVNSVII
jgi:hypothetical protein